MSHHIPVLLQEMLFYLNPKENGVYLDATFGGGGYTNAILEHTNCVVHALDRDPDAYERSLHLKERYGDRFWFHQGTFCDLTELFDAHLFDGIVFDFGVSSFQLDNPNRGFSFQHDGPLDMRMNPRDQTLTAADVVNTFDEAALTKIFHFYGEEPRARQVARAILKEREEKTFTTTSELAQCIREVSFIKKNIDRATLAFQGLRIFVNNELMEIDHGLSASLKILKDTGTLVTVSFHSLEDRLCKQFLNSTHFLKEQGLDKAYFKKITSKAIKPQDNEILSNPRSRSAKLRCGFLVQEKTPLC